MFTDRLSLTRMYPCMCVLYSDCPRLEDRRFACKCVMQLLMVYLAEMMGIVHSVDVKTDEDASVERPRRKRDRTYGPMRRKLHRFKPRSTPTWRRIKALESVTGKMWVYALSRA